MDLIKIAEEAFATGKQHPSFKAGDTVTVAYRIIEGNKERVQLYRGVVIKISGHGDKKRFKYKSFFVGGAVEYGLLPVSKEFLKNMFEDVFGENKITRSPHNFGMELHVGYCFNLWK